MRPNSSIGHSALAAEHRLLVVETMPRRNLDPGRRPEHRAPRSSMDECASRGRQVRPDHTGKSGALGSPATPSAHSSRHSSGLEAFSSGGLTGFEGLTPLSWLCATPHVGATEAATNMGWQAH